MFFSRSIVSVVAVAVFSSTQAGTIYVDDCQRGSCFVGL